MALTNRNPEQSVIHYASKKHRQPNHSNNPPYPIPPRHHQPYNHSNDSLFIPPIPPNPPVRNQPIDPENWLNNPPSHPTANLNPPNPIPPAPPRQPQPYNHSNDSLFIPPVSPTPPVRNQPMDPENWLNNPPSHPTANFNPPNPIPPRQPQPNNHSNDSLFIPHVPPTPPVRNQPIDPENWLNNPPSHPTANLNPSLLSSVDYWSQHPAHPNYVSPQQPNYPFNSNYTPVQTRAPTPIEMHYSRNVPSRLEHQLPEMYRPIRHSAYPQWFSVFDTPQRTSPTVPPTFNLNHLRENDDGVNETIPSSSPVSSEFRTAPYTSPERPPIPRSTLPLDLSIRRRQSPIDDDQIPRFDIPSTTVSTPSDCTPYYNYPAGLSISDSDTPPYNLISNLTPQYPARTSTVTSPANSRRSQRHTHSGSSCSTLPPLRISETPSDTPMPPRIRTPVGLRSPKLLPPNNSIAPQNPNRDSPITPYLNNERRTPSPIQHDTVPQLSPSLIGLPNYNTYSYNFFSQPQSSVSPIPSPTIPPSHTISSNPNMVSNYAPLSSDNLVFSNNVKFPIRRSSLLLDHILATTSPPIVRPQRPHSTSSSINNNIDSASQSSLPSIAPYSISPIPNRSQNPNSTDTLQMLKFALRYTGPSYIPSTSENYNPTATVDHNGSAEVQSCIDFPQALPIHEPNPSVSPSLISNQANSPEMENPSSPLPVERYITAEPQYPIPNMYESSIPFMSPYYAMLPERQSPSPQLQSQQVPISQRKCKVVSSQRESHGPLAPTLGQLMSSHIESHSPLVESVGQPMSSQTESHSALIKTLVRL
ncbi:uncharacterized protein LOC126911784 [Spodoptera frugiperda]|uniref:Uncharacterized protein LOC126911784 n=1 Tax=Spodoptera frugiperda TaxID=7108 RepID=A0A9R0E0K1_SPOFR|nr:uncharacterized protein LOC126911784 [Spodoptera frugiperda]